MLQMTRGYRDGSTMKNTSTLAKDLGSQHPDGTATACNSLPSDPIFYSDCHW